MENYSQIIMLVIASRNKGYDKMINDYWVPMIEHIKLHNLPIRVLLLFAKNYDTNDLSLSNDNKIIVDVKESLKHGILTKTIKSFEIVNNLYSYKHIIRTNLSSFYLLENMIKISNNLPSVNLYAGFPIWSKFLSNEFLSGASYWLSKDNVEHILRNKNKLNYRLSDDVTVGNIMKSKKKTILTRYQLLNQASGSEILNKSYHLQYLNNVIKIGEYYIRIKSTTAVDRTVDTMYLKSFTDLLYK